MKSIKSIKSILALATIAILSLMFLNSSLAANTAKITVETANLRESASSEAKILEQISQGEEVEFFEKTGDWYSVKYKGVSGYIQANLLSVNNTEDNTNKSATEEVVPQEQQSEESANTNQTQTNTDSDKYFVTEDSKLKSVPLINATDMIEIKKDSEVKVLQTKNGWAYIENDLSKGWIREENLKTEQQLKEEEQKAKQEQEAAQAEADLSAPAIKTAYVSSETVNLRSNNSTDSEILSSLVQNTAVEVLSEENGWSKCRVNGKVGYISTQYLSDKKIEKESTARSSTTSRTSTSKTDNSEVASVPSSGNSSSVVSIAMQYIGCSYVYGASGPSTFDCSGFTSYVYKQVGVSLSRTAQGQFSNGVSVSKDQLEPGDLVMFGSSTSNIYHVGIYIGGNKFVHAANPSRGVTTDTLSTYSGYVGAKRVL